VKRLLGPGGAKIKRIVEEAGQNVRVSVKGRGSVLHDGQEPAEEAEALALFITAQGSDAKERLDHAAALAEKLIADVHRDYEAFCSAAISSHCPGRAWPRRVPMPLQQATNDDDWISCRFPVGIAEDQEFRVVRRLLGRKGENVEHIAAEARNAAAAASGSSVRVSGKTIVSVRGCGARRSYAAKFDGDMRAEEGPLEIVVAAASSPAFERAAALVEELLSDVHQQYRNHCQQHELCAPDLVVCRESRRPLNE
jgi:hypothetical protein